MHDQLLKISVMKFSTKISSPPLRYIGIYEKILRTLLRMFCAGLNFYLLTSKNIILPSESRTTSSNGFLCPTAIPGNCGLTTSPGFCLFTDQSESLGLQHYLERVYI